MDEPQPRCRGCYCTDICIICNKRESSPCSDVCEWCLDASALLTGDELRHLKKKQKELLDN